MQKAGLNIQFSKKAHKKTLLKIQFFGPLLGVINLNTSFDGSSLWSNIQIHLDCNKDSVHQTLFDIGNNQWRARRNPKPQAKKILAPLTLQIPLKNCKEDDIKKIELTFTEKHSRRETKQEHIVWNIN